MSWSIKSIGTKENVAFAVESSETIPYSLRSAIVETISGINDDQGDMVRVEGYGHGGGGFSNIGKLEVEYFHAAKAPVSPEPAT